jgi:asparagine synthase (glutamine-hydrolysing)
MCGITGIFEYGSGHPVTLEQLGRMNEMLRHRGPDDEGYYTAPGVGLAMRRLSIIDVGGGHQPISNEDGSVWVIFNGEIYNYQALRAELLRNGHHLQTQSDTEVIPHLYEDYGTGCVDHLDGMFALAIYEQRAPKAGMSRDPQNSGRLLLARDRLGKKPLYYADLGGSLIFGSELKPILQDPRVSKDLDLEALHHYLSLLIVPAPYSIFKVIRKLPAGCILECDAHGVRVHRYWNALNFVDNRHLPEHEVVAEIRRLLFAAVEKRLIAEVPLGAFLSGGLDSSTVVAIMRRLKGAPVKTFSIGFEGPHTHNELPYARRLADHYRTDHHEFLIKPDIVETVQELVHYADEPFAISSSIPTFLIAKAAHQDVTVVLTGDGGDEVFGGYEHYLYERWAAAYRHLPITVDRVLMRSAGLLAGRLDGRVGRLCSRVQRFTSNARRSLSQRRLGWASGWSEIEKRRLYAPSIRHAFRATSTDRFLQEWLPDTEALEPAAQQNCLDMLVWLADEMLTKVDRMTMAASVEARCPLLDRHLVEYLLSLSFALKIPGWRRVNLKHLLRQAITDLLPTDLLRRPKHGFNVPLDAWFRAGAKAYLEATLSPERIRRRGIFDAAAVADLLAGHQRGQINASNRLYALLVFEVWAAAYL